LRTLWCSPGFFRCSPFRGTLANTPFGFAFDLLARKPEAAASAGNTGGSGALGSRSAGWRSGLLGGTYLALEQHQFTDNMTAGRGFIALAAIIFGNWQPRRVAVACLLFAAAETLQIQLQGMQLIPSQFVEMIPYVLTIVAIAVSSDARPRRQPSAE
jgi:simple sugar transport system permease protein